jgi:hypothetical protein
VIFTICSLLGQDRNEHAECREKRLFFRLGILTQGIFQQPVDGLGPRFNVLRKPEFIQLLQQIFLQVQVKWLKNTGLLL